MKQYLTLEHYVNGKCFNNRNTLTLTHAFVRSLSNGSSDVPCVDTHAVYVLPRMINTGVCSRDFSVSAAHKRFYMRTRAFLY